MGPGDAFRKPVLPELQVALVERMETPATGRNRKA
jgi:hypothetical protein